MSYDIAAASHLAITRTKRLQAHFYWPSLAQDGKDYVKSCDVLTYVATLDIVGKEGKPVPASLFPFRLMEKAFERVAIDIVGPLSGYPAAGNCFILTLIDHCTHFAFAIPLRAMKLQ